jgi:hypothetical protein
VSNSSSLEDRGVAEEKPASHVSGRRSWKTASMVAAVMVLLALVGVAFTDAKYSFALTYWVSLVPIFGLLCIGVAWARARHDGGLMWSAVVRQILHWIGIGVALGLDFFIRGTGEETATAAGLNAVLLLALGCFLAGVHLDWLFGLVGVLLTVALIVVTKANQYLWVIFVVGGLAAAFLLVLWWQLHSRKGGAGQPSAGS